MIHRQSISIQDYAQTKTSELNFWVAILGIATGLILGILLLRSFFTATLSEQTMIETVPAQQKMFQQAIAPAGYAGGPEDIAY